MELWEERLYPGELLGKFSSSTANFFSYNADQGKCSSLYSVLGEEQEVSARVSVLSAGTSNWCGAFCKHPLRPLWASPRNSPICMCRVMTPVALWSGSKHLLARNVTIYTENAFPGKRKETLLSSEQTSKMRALITGRIPSDFGQSCQQCSALYSFCIRQFLTC